MRRPLRGVSTARVALGAALFALLGSVACRESGGGSALPRATRKVAEAAPLVETAYDGEFRGGWADARNAATAPKGPVAVPLGPHSEWTIRKGSLKNRTYGALLFRFRGSGSRVPHLEVHLGSASGDPFPRVRLRAAQLASLPTGWMEALVEFSELNPSHLRFDSVTFLSSDVATDENVSFDGIGFTAPSGTDALTNPASSRVARRMEVDCRANAKPINPLVYGTSYYVITDKDDSQWQLGATGRRWGGDSTTRYNWQLGNAWNSGKDWYWENVEVPSYTTFLDANAAHHEETALTVPTIGWVAKDTTSFSFPVSEFGPQKDTDARWRPQAGNGMDPSGKPIAPGPPTKTSVAAPPEFVAKWVRAIRERDRARNSRSVRIYMLDNETALWNTTHRDVHPEPLGYDELLQRTLSYGAAVRGADPDALIAGPAAWGWPELFFSAKDSSAGLDARPDRRAHGDTPLLPWYLSRLREEERRTGVHVLDLVDVHFYPQAEGIYGEDGKVDPKSAALRIRSTRGLWDPEYTDESWVREPIFLLPRLRRWIDENFPGRGIVIGEWNFGAERHMSGGLATAEALGRFGQYGVSAAFYWTFPKAGTPAFQAFRAFRNFDGSGGRFLDYSLPTLAPGNASLFASRDAGGRHMVLVALNLSPEEALTADIELTACPTIARRTAYVFAEGEKAGFRREPLVTGEVRTLRQTLPPWSMTVLDVELAGAISGGIEH
ncbi:MAG TPA: glycoside hydrolase family 44 protein [Polyangiaceae bacterium]|nr:glycoside hydrolase family 44 protein [Polyangiaceae bacterium]